MKPFERHQQILNALRERHSVKVTELAERFGVSEGTIRNDLDYLSETDQVRRVRGGAMLSTNHQIRHPEFAARARVQAPSKQQIARWAADIVHDGEAIFLDASTTAFYMVPHLEDRRNLTVITSGIETAVALSRNPSFTVILLGGVVRPGAVSVAGPISEMALEALHVKTAFVSCAGFSVKAGLTDADIQVAQLKSQVVRSAETVVALVESSKFGQVQVSSFTGLERISQILTDRDLAPAHIDQLRRTGVILTICGQKSISSYTPYDEEVAHFKIGFANLSEERPYAVGVRRGLEQAVQERGHIDLLAVDNQYDNQVALRAADRLIAAGVDLAIEYHFDEKTCMVLVDKFGQAGIPLIAVDSPMVGATFFGVDNYRSGRDGGLALGRWIQSHWDGQIDRLIVLEHTVSNPLLTARITGQLAGLAEVLGEIPAERIISLDDQGGAADIEALVGGVLDSLPGLHRLAAISDSDSTAEDIVAAARKAGREADLACASQGAGTRFIRDELRRADSCVVTASLFRPETYGRHLVDLAQRILRGEQVPPAVYIDHVVVDAGNINDYYPDR